MKTRIFAYFTVILIVALLVYSTVRIDRELTDILNYADSIDTKSSDALCRAQELSKNFQKAQKFISLFVSHNDLTNIEDALAEFIGLLRVGEEKEAEVVKSRLKSSLEHLKRLSGINPEAII